MKNTAEQYGQALYALARDEQIAALLQEQMLVLTESFRQVPDFLRLLSSPRLSKQERCDLLEESFRKKIHLYLLNFLKILTREGVICKFPDCHRRFQACYYADHGILPVQVYTPQPLTAEQTRQLTEKMESITGKRVLLDLQIDPSSLGGMRLCYDGKQIDGTVKSRLEAMGRLLKNTVL